MWQCVYKLTLKLHLGKFERSRDIRIPSKILRRQIWGVFSQEEHLRGMQLKQKLYLHLISRHVCSRNIFTKEISFTTFLSYKVVWFQIFSKSKRWEILCPRLWQGHCSRLTKEYSNFIEWKATQSKQPPKPLSRHPSPAGLRFSAPAIQGKCVFPTLELSSRVCPAGVLPRGERGDELEVTSTHTHRCGMSHPHRRLPWRC